MKRTAAIFLTIILAISVLAIVPAAADDEVLTVGELELSPVVFSAPNAQTDSTTAEVVINVENPNALPLISATITVRIPGCTITGADGLLDGQYIVSDPGTDTLNIMWANLSEGVLGEAGFAKLTVSLPEDADAGSSFDIEITVSENDDDGWFPGDYNLGDGTEGSVSVAASAQNGSIVFGADQPTETALLSGETDDTAEAPATGVKTSPQTGDGITIAVAALIAAALVSALTAAKKKKER